MGGGIGHHNYEGSRQNVCLATKKKLGAIFDKFLHP